MNKLMMSFASVACVVGFAQAEMEPATPESQGVDSCALVKFIDACEQTFDAGKAGAFHGFVIVRHGKTIAEGSWKPFDTLNETHMLYSHSKSFTSSAIGFLVDDGKLDLDERVVDLFPEDLPANPCERLRQLRVRDLLTMNVGSDSDHRVARDPDWVKSFLAKEFHHDPGTHFKYDSDATYMLAAIVEKKTGKRIMDFLKERMFDKIGITKAWSNTSPQGVACGGWGMNMTTRELARFGQLYLQHGYWEGKNLISPYWVALATARNTWSGWQRVGAQRLGEGSDWEQGYGFQFWRCSHNCYRADGAYGQYTVVMPDQDAVVSIHAGLGDMAKELQLVWDYLLPAMQEKKLPENSEALAALRGRTAALSIAPVKGVSTAKDADKLLCDYAIEKNSRGIKAVRLMKEGKGWQMKFFARAWPQTFPIGFGEWKKGTITIDNDNFEGLGTVRGDQPTAASAAFQPDGSLKCRVYLTGATHYLDFRFFLENGEPKVEGELYSMGGVKFKGAKLVAPVVPSSLPKTDDRAAVRKFFEEKEFGVRPVEKPSDLAFKVLAENVCLGGKAVHKAVEISTKGKFAPFAFVVHAYIPKAVKSAPTMVAINLGNRLADQKFAADAEDPSTKSWPIKDAIDRGVATIGFRNWDVAFDDAGKCFQSGVFKAFGPVERTATSWGALSAWAWGASRCVDWMETQPGFDLKRIGVVGHSRGGKTALWAGVTDPRFSLVCVNDSGCAGSKLNRMPMPWSETIEAITTVFPHWFATDYRQFAKDNGCSMPYDQNNLLGLVLPRKLVVASATQDDWAGPHAEEAAAKAVGAIHFYREGPHDITPFDWAKYMDNL